MADYIDDDFVREKDITQKSKIIRKRTAKEVSSSKYTLSSKDLDLDLDSSSDKLHSTPLKQKIMLQIEPIQDDEDMYGDVDEEEDEDSAEKSRDSYKTAQCNDHLVDKSYETDGDQQGDAKDDDDQLYRSSSTQIRDANVDHGTGLEQHLEDFCEELFKENTATVIGEIKRAFKKINEAKKKFDQRHNESCI